MFTLHCKPLYAPTDITPPNAYPTLARLHRHTYQTCLIIKPIPWGKSDRARNPIGSADPPHRRMPSSPESPQTQCP